jgi:hypothetical protein
MTRTIEQGANRSLCEKVGQMSQVFQAALRAAPLSAVLAASLRLPSAGM